jgi:hypothetical protein
MGGRDRSIDLKNQNDLIVAGAVILVCIGVSLAFFFQKREPAPIAAPTPVVTADAQPVPANVKYANSLPGGGGAGGAGGPAGGGRVGAGPELGGGGAPGPMSAGTAVAGG